MKKCIFCDEFDQINNKLTKEHVLPRWLSAQQGLTDLPRFEGERRIETRRLRQNWLGTYNNFAVKRICRACNSGWMADLEGRAKDVLNSQFLMSSETRSLTNDERVTLAVWISKTMIVHSALRLPKDEQLLEAGVRLRAGDVPRNFHPFIADASSYVLYNAETNNSALVVDVDESQMRQILGDDYASNFNLSTKRWEIFAMQIGRRILGVVYCNMPPPWVPVLNLDFIKPLPSNAVCGIWSAAQLGLVWQSHKAQLEKAARKELGVSYRADLCILHKLIFVVPGQTSQRGLLDAATRFYRAEEVLYTPDME